MRKSIKKTAAVVTSAAMTLTLLSGVGLTKNVNAEDNLLAGANWVHTHEAWELNDAKLAQTTVWDNSTGGFTANISITGWQREWYGEEYMPDDVWPFMDGWCDKPFQLTSDAVMTVTPHSTYELKFDIQNEMTTEDGKKPTEKNVTVLVKPDDGGDNLLLTTVRIPANGSYQFDRKFTVPDDYAGSSVTIEFAYGSYAYSYEISCSPFLKLMPDDVREKYVWAPGTTEDVNAAGKLDFSNISAVQVEYEAPTVKNPADTDKPEETTAPSGGVTYITQVIEKCTCNPNNANVTSNGDNNKPTTVTEKKVAKPSISAKNVKSKKIQVTWKKVTGATKYQVRAVAGSKKITKTTSKTKYVLTKLQKKTYKVSVRAYGQAGYGNWSKVKKVKVKK